MSLSPGSFTMETINFLIGGRGRPPRTHISLVSCNFGEKLPSNQRAPLCTENPEICSYLHSWDQVETTRPPIKMCCKCRILFLRSYFRITEKKLCTFREGSCSISGTPKQNEAPSKLGSRWSPRIPTLMLSSNLPKTQIPYVWWGRGV